MPLSALLKGLLTSTNKIQPLSVPNLGLKFFSTQPFHSHNPLVLAIRNNNHEGVVKLLQEGRTTKLADLKEALRTGVHALNLEIIKSLDDYDALPEEVSLPVGGAKNPLINGAGR